MMSIFHRATGMALYGGMLLVVWWLIAASYSDAYFDFVNGLFASWLGRIIMLGLSWALIHHALGGIRHFIWDTGKGFRLATVESLVRANLIGSILLTLALWIVAYWVRG